MPKTHDKKALEVSPERAAVIIQSLFRGYRERKVYHLRFLTPEDRENYPVNVRGNDPEFSIPAHAETDKIVLVATGGLRAVDIACKLGPHCPKLMIIDNSAQVIAFWRSITKISSASDDMALFLKQLQAYYLQEEDLQINSERDFQYITHLFQNHGFEKVNGIIRNTSVIAQSWADKATFFSLRQIIDRHKYQRVYAYPSNIVSYLYVGLKKQSAATEVVKNIATLKPNVAFVTNCCQYRFKPNYARAIENPSEASYALML